MSKLPGTALRLAPENREKILSLLDVEACPGRERPVFHKTRALLKIQDGCDQFCTFCIVPYVRGRSKSTPVEEVVRQARDFEAQGYQEVVLTGIHLSIWGHDLDGEPDLSDLVAAILAGTESVRVRLSSVEPDRFPLALVDLMAANPRICPYLHLVLQHASDAILERMHRGYTLKTYRQIVEKFFAQVPHAALSSDIMVGFPGETEQDFRELMSYLRETPFYHLHVFPYSVRQGTAASKFKDQVDKPTQRLRRDKVLRLAEKLRVRAMRAAYGRRMKVLFETVWRPGWLRGTAHNGMSVVAKAGPVLLNREAEVLITRRLGRDLVGQETTWRG